MLLGNKAPERLFEICITVRSFSSTTLRSDVIIDNRDDGHSHENRIQVVTNRKYSSVTHVRIKRIKPWNERVEKRNKSRGVRGWEERDKMRKCEEKIETYLQKERVGGAHNVWFDLKYIQLSYKSQKYTVIP